MWELSISIPVFIVSALVIGVAGTRLSGVLDHLADRTGLGEAFVGAVLLGACTSLPGITASIAAAVDGHPVVALSNAIGGIAAQTAFLAIADIAYPKANLEHAAASLPNLMQGTLLIVLLGALMLGIVGPDISFLGISPLTPLLLLAYIFGLRIIYKARTRPMWQPRMTHDTKVDLPEEESQHSSLALLWSQFAITAVFVIGAGWAVTRASESIMAKTGISATVAGAVLIAVTTSLPELVTSVSAVRRGALTLAVSGVIGGNAFDTLFAAVADVAYRPGSIYHTASAHAKFLLALTIIMTGVLLMGLLHREKSGFGNIGFESALILALYALGLVVMALPL